ncbi:MAG: Na+/H+ antiporter NhaA [Acidobacteriia bacterium]|nr:Na+/H+ antiporter NhaA [Terriglobia bacterium]
MPTSGHSAPVPPKTPAERILRPFQEFLRIEASAGILLLLCTVAALTWANSGAGSLYFEMARAPVTVGVGPFVLSKPIVVWINDGLMAIFFLVVGLEIKREVLVGELSSPRRAALPLLAAAGGMIVPAAIYLSLNAGTDRAAGWGIPVATDIAFAIGVLTLVGKRAPLGAKVFLTALAIADDLGAVLVIAIFYGGRIDGAALGAVAALMALLFAANRVGVRSPLVYGLLGVGLWLAVSRSGVHPTVAGILLAAAVPSRSGIEHALHPWVMYLIMPVFAFFNAAVVLKGSPLDALLHPATLGVVLGLVVGKPVGITLSSWLAVRAGLAALPEGVGWRQIIGVACLGGIGFTMSLFIAGLAFDGSLLASAKTGILMASAAAGVLGWLSLRGSRVPTPRPSEGPSGPDA